MHLYVWIDSEMYTVDILTTFKTYYAQLMKHKIFTNLYIYVVTLLPFYRNILFINFILF